MSNITTYQKQSDLLEISHGTGVIQYEVSNTATLEQKEVIAALNAPKVKAISDRELDTLLAAFINKALILLGHHRQLTGKEDQTILITELAKLIREKYNLLTTQEVLLVLEMGVRGDLKNKPEDVVYLNLEQINGWFKKFRQENKPAAMKQLKPYEEPKQLPAHFDQTELLNAFISLIKGPNCQITDLEWLCQTATHYDWLKKNGAFNLPYTEYGPATFWNAIYYEEKAKVLLNARHNLEFVQKVTKVAFNLFSNSTADTNNRYEKTTLTNCRIRVFREWIMNKVKEEGT